MMLICGGGGFIGRHVAGLLVRRGDHVRILDNYVPQVHGDQCPEVHGAANVFGSVTDRRTVASALDGVTHVLHLAAEVGVGQSAYEVTRYVSANSYGTAVLLEEITKRRDQIRRLVVASSMSVYGEGDSVRTPEIWPLAPTSVYAITKRDQEELCLVVGRALRIPTIALRLFNTYGPGQALGNPYTGAVAIFARRALAGEPPLVYEDGLQTRDFVEISDVARAFVSALDAADTVTGVFNVGTGIATTVLSLAEQVATLLGGPAPLVLHKARVGDVRHCVADVTKIAQRLGWRAEVRLVDGLRALVPHLQAADVSEKVPDAHGELIARGLVA